jgi:hypothetical protein
MMALGEHLGAHQDIQAAGGKVLQQVQGFAAMGDGIPVQAGSSMGTLTSP